MSVSRCVSNPHTVLFTSLHPISHPTTAIHPGRSAVGGAGLRPAAIIRLGYSFHTHIETRSRLGRRVKQASALANNLKTVVESFNGLWSNLLQHSQLSLRSILPSSARGVNRESLTQEGYWLTAIKLYNRLV